MAGIRLAYKQLTKLSGGQKQRTLFVLGSQYVLLEGSVRVPFDGRMVSDPF